MKLMTSPALNLHGLTPCHATRLTKRGRTKRGKGPFQNQRKPGWSAHRQGYLPFEEVARAIASEPWYAIVRGNAEVRVLPKWPAGKWQ